MIKSLEKNAQTVDQRRDFSLLISLLFEGCNTAVSLKRKIGTL